MPSVLWQELGPSPGSCTVCAAADTLMLGEARTRLGLLERLRREYCPPPSRFVTCSDCGWRWSVRAADTGIDGARGRTEGTRGVHERPATRLTDSLRRPVVEPARSEPVAATRTVLPAPRDGRRFARDWTYPRG
jgi:hypothetical protein